jgi:hypothetical protein
MDDPYPNQLQFYSGDRLLSDTVDLKQMGVKASSKLSVFVNPEVLGR